MKKLIITLAVIAIITAGCFIAYRFVPGVAQYVDKIIEQFLRKNTEERITMLVFPGIVVVGGLALSYAIRKHNREQREKMIRKEKQEELRRLYQRPFFYDEREWPEGFHKDKTFVLPVRI